MVGWCRSPEQERLLCLANICCWLPKVASEGVSVYETDMQLFQAAGSLPCWAGFCYVNVDNIPCPVLFFPSLMPQLCLPDAPVMLTWAQLSVAAHLAVCLSVCLFLFMQPCLCICSCLQPPQMLLQTQTPPSSFKSHLP